MILVITGRSESMQLTINGVGIGLSLQVFFAERSVNLTTLFSDSCENRSIMGNGRRQLLLDEGRAENSEAMLSNFTWILQIFSIK